MRKRGVGGEDEEGGAVDDANNPDDDKSKSGDRSSPILLLMAIAFCLAVLYLAMFGNADYGKRKDSGRNAGVDVTPIALTAPAEVVSTSMVSPLPSGCLREIPPVDSGPHIVAPPAGPVDLVCCVTTKGVWNIAVHKAWAPIGADNFLKMVTTGFFSSRVPLFRSLKGFLIQFGLAGDPAVQTSFETSVLKGKHGNLADDPPWLPLGPSGRQVNKVARFQKGYLAYAGAGKNSRGTQLIVAFEDNLYLGGGSPWEVPWGQLVGNASFATLASIYTGYGEAPSQGKIRNRGKAYTEAEFPQLDYVLSCQVAAQDLPWKSTVTTTFVPPGPGAQERP